jgi:hypothetical protein
MENCALQKVYQNSITFQNYNIMRITMKVIQDVLECGTIETQRTDTKKTGSFKTLSTDIIPGE